MPAAMELEANLNFLGAFVAPTPKERVGAEKEPASSRKLSLVGAAYSLRQCSSHESVQFRPLLPCRVTGSALESTDEPHAGKLARVVLAGDPGILY